MYSTLLAAIVRDAKEQDILFDSIEDSSVITAKNEWSLNQIRNKSLPFAMRLLVYAIVQTIFSASTVASLYWFQLGGTMPGLCHANELVFRDECLHAEFACLLFNRLNERPSDETVRDLVLDAVFLEKEFFLGMSPFTVFVRFDL